ncbi:MAG: 2-succinyl-5-enolpyruvyl-6-hydroxy-3-cyclohexene-1-carboxylic-acid synthase, partial [candidate division Zixibacteria bacterium]|nr:2-succinyl-5-enolpyruvyl-6-hydroxy-3-cyclohexene-1-carboxylic-acid synthase [candidate division Zixibacteria bacterium]
AAFLALGHARAAGNPAALVCTSGTAVANYLPAVIEASSDFIPMVVLSADRPPELHQTGANQTIEQAGIFGESCRRRFVIPCPDEKIQPEFVLTTIDQAVYGAINVPAGPVHLNLEYREPLAPNVESAVSPVYVAPLEGWSHSDRPFTRYTAPDLTVSITEIESLAARLKSAERGLLVIGRLAQWGNQRSAVAGLARALGWPVIADIGSGLRLGVSDGVHLLPHADPALLDDKGEVNLQCVLQIGGGLVSRRVTEYIGRQTGCEYILVNDHPFRQDPGHRVTSRFECDIESFARSLTAALKISERSKGTSRLEAANDAVAKLISETLDKSDTLSEITVPRVVAQELPAGQGLWLASSMPIRDFDMLAPTGQHSPRVGCNRGASGIDGTVASACGFARGLNQPTTVVVGDLALLHDLNSLALVTDSKQPPMTIVVINNGGGGIFSLLPVARLDTKVTGPLFDRDSDTFEREVIEPLFLTTHEYRFAQAASMFGLGYGNPSTVAEFRREYRASVSGKRSTLIELTFDWRESRRVRREMNDRIVALLARLSSHA